MLFRPELTALFSVIVIDLVLAGDNAIVVGMAAAGLPRRLRHKAIVIGIAVAALLRILFAFAATYLLTIVPLVLIGGFLLLWVAWKLWRETRRPGDHGEADLDVGASPPLAGAPPGRAAGDGKTAVRTKTFTAALAQIVAADVSMSLDNVLAVAGTARDHRMVMVIGLLLSVVLMGVAATLVARLLRRYPWISYLGLVLIAWVALAMIWEGSVGMMDMAHHARFV